MQITIFIALFGLSSGNFLGQKPRRLSFLVESNELSNDSREALACVEQVRERLAANCANIDDSDLKFSQPKTSRKLTDQIKPVLL